jgi:hypothetical protein
MEKRDHRKFNLISFAGANLDQYVFVILRTRLDITHVMYEAKGMANTELILHHPRSRNLHLDFAWYRASHRNDKSDRPTHHPSSFALIVSRCECTTRSRSYFFRYPFKSSLARSLPLKDARKEGRRETDGKSGTS